jgi:hypothetical protein
VWSKRIPREDPRLDWSPQHDPRSRDYPVRRALRATPTIAPKRWRLGAITDQHSEGACVGHGHTTDLIASPYGNFTVDSTTASLYAAGIYHRAKQIDEWPGEAYDGTSVLAGAKVMAERGLIGGYYWAFDNDDIRDAVIAIGPVVIGIPWYESMYETKANGVVVIDGEMVGGHCLCIFGYHPGLRIYGEPPSDNPRGPNYHEVFRWRNSWSTLYGRNGNGIIHARDLRALLADMGEACVATGRTRATLT